MFKSCVSRARFFSLNMIPFASNLLGNLSILERLELIYIDLIYGGG